MSRALQQESEKPSNATGQGSSTEGRVQPQPLKEKEPRSELTIGGSLSSGGTATGDSFEELVYGEVRMVPGDTCGNAQRITARLLELLQAGLI